MKGITISVGKGGVSVSNSYDYKSNPVVLTDEEKKAVDFIRSALCSLSDAKEPFHLERRTNSYLTLVYGDAWDFCRVKIGVRSKWVSVSLSTENRKEYFDDPRISKSQNKNQFHWKIPLASVSDIENCVDLLQKSYFNAVEAEKARQS